MQPERSIATASPGYIDPDYKIDKEDVLEMNIWGEPELSKKMLRVTPEGTVNVPYIGEIKVVGLSVREVTDEIAGKYEEAQILYNPRIEIVLSLIHTPTVRVLGSVGRPGEVPFRKGDRIMDAIAAAGSYQDDGWLEKAILTHRGSQEAIPIDLKKMFEQRDFSQNFELQRGDTIYIPPEEYQNKFYVLGHVIRPGIYDLKDNTTVLTAVNLAGGPNERGLLRSTVVIRNNAGKPERLQVNLTKLLDQADVAQDVKLMPGDVVMVPETKKPDWGKISQVLSTILSFSYLRRYGLF